MTPVSSERAPGRVAATWADVLTRAHAELPETTVVMWFADVAPMALDGDVLTLAVPSTLVKERLQHNHLALIEDAAAASAGRPVKIDFVVDEAVRATVPLGVMDEPVVAPRAPAATPDRRRTVPLGAPGLPFPAYTFDACANRLLGPGTNASKV